MEFLLKGGKITKPGEGHCCWFSLPCGIHSRDVAALLWIQCGDEDAQVECDLSTVCGGWGIIER